MRKIILTIKWILIVLFFGTGVWVLKCVRFEDCDWNLWTIVWSVVGATYIILWATTPNKLKE